MKHFEDLYGLYFDDSEFAHVGRSKRDGAKVGSGRYHLGSGEHPYQHVKKTDISKTGLDVKPSKKTIGVSNGTYTIYGNEGMLYKGINVNDALSQIKEPVQQNLLKDIQNSNAIIEKIKVQKNSDDNSTILRVDLNRDFDTLSKGYKTASSASVIRDELTVNQLQNLGYKIRYVSTDDKFNIKCIQARKGKSEAEINFLTNKEIRNPNVVPVAVGTVLGGIPAGTVTAIVSSKRKYKNYMEHSLSTDLYNMYFGSYEEDTDVAHVGRSKRDGAKVGSGRYPLGSGKNPNQHEKKSIKESKTYNITKISDSLSKGKLKNWSKKDIDNYVEHLNNSEGYTNNQIRINNQLLNKNITPINPGYDVQEAFGKNTKGCTCLLDIRNDKNKIKEVTNILDENGYKIATLKDKSKNLLDPKVKFKGDVDYALYNNKNDYVEITYINQDEPVAKDFYAPGKKYTNMIGAAND